MLSTLSNLSAKKTGGHADSGPASSSAGHLAKDPHRGLSRVAPYFRQTNLIESAMLRPVPIGEVAATAARFRGGIFDVVRNRESEEW